MTGGFAHLTDLTSCGGAELHTLVDVVERDMFAASTMAAGGDVAFEQMKLPQLKEELAARDAKRAGMKAVLQRRLHALLVHAAIARRAEAHRRRRAGRVEARRELTKRGRTLTKSKRGRTHQGQRA